MIAGHAGGELPADWIALGPRVQGGAPFDPDADPDLLADEHNARTGVPPQTTHLDLMGDVGRMVPGGSRKGSKGNVVRRRPSSFMPRLPPQL